MNSTTNTKFTDECIKFINVPEQLWLQFESLHFHAPVSYEMQPINR